MEAVSSFRLSNLSFPGKNRIVEGRTSADFSSYALIGDANFLIAAIFRF
jgi:hypothetical protein